MPLPAHPVDTPERFPGLDGVLNLRAGQISNEDMVEMTYQVDVEKRAVDDVAREFLIGAGLLQN